LLIKRTTTVGKAFVVVLLLSQYISLCQGLSANTMIGSCNSLELTSKRKETWSFLFKLTLQT
jgi:hypothetical protein